MVNSYEGFSRFVLEINLIHKIRSFACSYKANSAVNITLYNV